MYYRYTTPRDEKENITCMYILFEERGRKLAFQVYNPSRRREWVLAPILSEAKGRKLCLRPALNL